MAAGRVGSGIPPASELPTLPSPAVPRQLAKVKLSKLIIADNLAHGINIRLSLWHCPRRHLG